MFPCKKIKWGQCLILAGQGLGTVYIPGDNGLERGSVPAGGHDGIFGFSRCAGAQRPRLHLCAIFLHSLHQPLPAVGGRGPVTEEQHYLQRSKVNPFFVLTSTVYSPKLFNACKFWVTRSCLWRPWFCSICNTTYGKPSSHPTRSVVSNSQMLATQVNENVYGLFTHGLT